MYQKGYLDWRRPMQDQNTLDCLGLIEVNSLEVLSWSQNYLNLQRRTTPFLSKFHPLVAVQTGTYPHMNNKMGLVPNELHWVPANRQ